MLFGGGDGVIVEVVNHNRRTVRRDVKVQLKEESIDGARSGEPSGEGEKNVALIIEEVE